MFRVVGLPGDTLSLEGRTLRVDGDVQHEPHAWYALPGGLGGDVSQESYETAASFPEVAVPPRSVFVLGDNRLNAIDSRYHGPIPFDDVVGIINP